MDNEKEIQEAICKRDFRGMIPVSKVSKDKGIQYRGLTIDDIEHQYIGYLVTDKRRHCPST